MPTIITNGSASARSFGFQASGGTPITVSYILVAGGGPGGNYAGTNCICYFGGGGGAGGVLKGTTVLNTALTYSYCVGAGGTFSSNGSNTTFTGLTSAIGGGIGAVQGVQSATSGGSGGGGSVITNTTGGLGTSGQGFAGGNGGTIGGGGGGASAVGDSGLTTGNGGKGVICNFFPTWSGDIIITTSCGIKKVALTTTSGTMFSGMALTGSTLPACTFVGPKLPAANTWAVFSKNALTNTSYTGITGTRYVGGGGPQGSGSIQSWPGVGGGAVWNARGSSISNGPIFVNGIPTTGGGGLGLGIENTPCDGKIKAHAGWGGSGAAVVAYCGPQKFLSSSGPVYCVSGKTVHFMTGTGTLKAAPAVFGSQSYTTNGTFTWVAPAGVTSVSVVAIGGGGNGGVGVCACCHGGAGGGGGGLGYVNNYSVTPGNSYTVVVGAAQGNSYFVSTAVVKGGGASGQSGGTYTGNGGGNGGSGGAITNNQKTGGGAGAGGYAGCGGTGGYSSGALAGSTTNHPGATGNGGGGGGGSSSGGAITGGGGGGTGIYGQGLNGLGNCSTSATGGGGFGGSYGAQGESYFSTSSAGTNGGAFGGGGGGGGYAYNGPGSGGIGAVRIVWPGTIRKFPATCVGGP